MTAIYTSDEIGEIITNAHCYISKLSLKMIDDIVMKGSSYLEDRFFYLMDLMTAIEDRANFDGADPDFNQLVALLESEVGDSCCSFDPTFTFIYSPLITPVISVAYKYFIDLLDTPKSYTDQAGLFVAVKQDETGLEFINIIEIIDSL